MIQIITAILGLFPPLSSLSKNYRKDVFELGVKVARIEQRVKRIVEGR